MQVNHYLFVDMGMCTQTLSDVILLFCAQRQACIVDVLSA